ncbi:hypothetical protein [Myroides odoratimimus]|uniref:Uncharacterized protein n=4 Tax=Myroides TaxID=76831 RepID=A0AAI8G5Z6_9FLAO|nr:hypothetical protein [Myroides odoratimimus]ALU27283.1 hypothetical protein AS202_14435 [Myroides odoratimimus]EHO08371.1 hypothetical protein HMPREF9712_02033 [Myroides odoratimimus CCUG 10230]MCA4807556.1 hypothetical protein [Myroides odoratimimus]MCO7724630.1 hypothetical protein [Myroides odoratimimus]MCS7474246.1 hypothetical protein [Myroides odoratimimus]
MKRKLIAFSLFLLTQSIFSQNEQRMLEQANVCFDEFKHAAEQHKSLWDIDLYGPLLLVDPETRNIYANEGDRFKKEGNIYTGILPKNINIANTAIEWEGKRWAMIMLPLSDNVQNRINLLGHESFHRVQPTLGFKLNNTDNNHLDQKEGRVYLRLELEALKQAIQANSIKERNQHLTAALSFRKYRQSLYNESYTTENNLELNEGIAEFTGLIVSNRTKKETVDYVSKGIDDFFKNSTYIRSFAYHTIPVYGYLLSQQDKEWNKKINTTTNLTDYFIKVWNIQIPNNLEGTVNQLKSKYNGAFIIEQEVERENKVKKIIAAYKAQFVENPHFEIKFEKMNISFNPSNLVALEDKGTVYPTMRISDKWGILTVEKGALMSPNWDRLSITNPTKVEENKVFGDGWILELTEHYKIEQNKDDLNYRLVKK